jgi:hypothetical protein
MHLLDVSRKEWTALDFLVQLLQHEVFLVEKEDDGGFLEEWDLKDVAEEHQRLVGSSAVLVLVLQHLYNRTVFHLGARHGVSKGVEDGSRPPAGHKRVDFGGPSEILVIPWPPFAYTLMCATGPYFMEGPVR